MRRPGKCQRDLKPTTSLRRQGCLAVARETANRAAMPPASAIPEIQGIALESPLTDDWRTAYAEHEAGKQSDIQQKLSGSS